MRKIVILIADRKSEVQIFRTRFALEGHVYKHFLSPQENWSNLDSVKITDSMRHQIRNDIDRAGCKGEKHHPCRCKSFDDCSHQLFTKSWDYIAKIEDTLIESSKFNQELYFLTHEKDPVYVFLSVEGIIVFVRGERQQFSVVSAYLGPFKECGMGAFTGDQFISSLDYIYRKYIKRYRVDVYYTWQRWEGFLTSVTCLLKGSMA